MLEFKGTGCAFSGVPFRALTARSLLAVPRSIDRIYSSMTAKVIRELAALLPKNCGYLTRGPGRFLPGNYAIENCVGDPRFGWNFVGAFIQSRQPFPPQVLNPELRRTFSHLHYREADEAVQTAIAWDFPRNSQRYALNALLLCPDIALPEIAQLFGLSAEEVRVYEQLFYNVRDRLSDAGYIAKLVFPLGRSPVTKDNLLREDPGQPFLRAAFNHGKTEVLHMAGLIRPQSDGMPVDKLAEEFERGLLAQGVMALRHGHGSSPELKNAKDLLLARMKVVQPEQAVPDKGLEALSISHGILETLQGIQADDIKKRIYLPDEPNSLAGGNGS